MSGEPERDGGDNDVIVSPTGGSLRDAARTGTRSSESQAQEIATASAPPPTPFVCVPETVLTPVPYTFDMRGQWEGTVTAVHADEFSVVLRDIFNAASDEYEAVFSIDEIARDDRDLLTVGAILYWTIGYQERRGQRLRVSDVRLRRLPAWSRADMKKVEQAAAQLDELFEG